MFLLGHIGISLGIVYSLASLSPLRKKGNSGTSFTGNIDFRLVIIAAILPDIIDKIVGMIILKDEISNGRLFMHSMVIIGIFTICLIILSRIKFDRVLKTLFYISPIWIHLLLDRMWEDPHTLFWPIFGTSFPRLDVEFTDYFTMLFSDLYIFVGEILGILVIITLFIRHRLFIGNSLYCFLKDGKLRTYSKS